MIVLFVIKIYNRNNNLPNNFCLPKLAGVFFNELQEQILKRVTLEKKEPRSIDKFIWDFDDFEHYKVFLYSSVS